MFKKIAGVCIILFIAVILIYSFNRDFKSSQKFNTKPEVLPNTMLDKNCKITQRCGKLIGVDCNAEADGPFYYIEEKTGKVIAHCGGYCDGRECSDCPPKEWTCK